MLCITHLAQVAAAATSHVRIDKHDGHTTLTSLDAAASIDELCRMLGGAVDDAAVRQHATNLKQGRFVRGAATGAEVDAPLTLDC